MWGVFNILILSFRWTGLSFRLLTAAAAWRWSHRAASCTAPPSSSAGSETSARPPCSLWDKPWRVFIVWHLRYVSQLWEYDDVNDTAEATSDFFHPYELQDFSWAHLNLSGTTSLLCGTAPDTINGSLCLQVCRHGDRDPYDLHQYWRFRKLVCNQSCWRTTYYYFFSPVDSVWLRRAWRVMATPPTFC